MSDDNIEDYDAYEEDVWYADHDNYESYFDEYEINEEIESTAEQTQKVQDTVTDVLKQYVSDPDAVPSVPLAIRGNLVHKLEVGSGSGVAKVFLSNQFLDGAESRQRMGAAVAQCLQERIFNQAQLDNAFLSHYRELLSTDDALANLSAFAINLHEENIWTDDMLEMLDTVRSVQDTDAELKRIKAEIRAAVLEYLTSNDMDEVLRCFDECCANFYHYEIIKTVVNISMDQGPKSRERTSLLIGESAFFSQVSVRRGFEILIERLEDLRMDIPDAMTMISCFIARAIVDEAIPPSFIQEVAFQPMGMSPLAISCLQKAQHLLNMKFSAQRVAKIWGSGRGRPVSELKEDISLMLKAYLSSNDMNELAISLKDLEEPNFNHEYVKQAVLKGAEKGKDSVDAVGSMLLSFMQKDLVSAYQVKIGLQRVRNGLPNYSIDLPLLPKYLVLVDEMVQTELQALAES